MTRPPRRSDVSGELLDADAPTEVTYVFPDGHRRTVAMTVSEAAPLRALGEDRTTRSSRLKASVNWGKLLAWTGGVVGGALIANWIGGSIGDRYADKQRELELEADLVQEVSVAAVTLFQKAQEASRATSAPDQIDMRDAAADAWVRDSGRLTPQVETYYPDDSAVLRHWSAFQDAMYDWAVLGCCTTPGRSELVDSIRDYVTTYVGEPTRPAPVSDPWGALAASDAPDRELYQWVGFYLLRGRGALLDDLREESARLD